MEAFNFGLGADWEQRKIRELMEQRGVLVFREINFDDEEQLAFTRTLGNLAPEIYGEEVYKVTLDQSANARSDYLKGSMYWHLDGTMNQVPILASILSAKVLSPTGGDTDFGQRLRQVLNELEETV